MDIDKYIKNELCPICHIDNYTILVNNKYETLSVEDIHSIYKSSSNIGLFDQLVMCNTCKLIYTNPRVSNIIFENSYSNVEDDDFIKQNHLRIHTFSQFFKKWTKEYLKLAKSNYKILDVGCAAGALPKALYDYGFNVVGVEPSRYLCKYGKEKYKLDLREGFLNDQKFLNNEFDIISMFDVIEHINRPDEILIEINRILSPNGYLLINYPEYDSWPRKILKSKWPFFLNVHLYYFTPITIKKLLNKSGFNIIKYEPYYQTLELGYILSRISIIFPTLDIIRKIVIFCKLDKLAIKYYIGQTFITAHCTKDYTAN